MDIEINNVASHEDFQEIELKLKLHDPQLVESILKDSLIIKLSRGFRPLVKENITTYYDTFDYRLLDNQVCYRIRNSAGEYTATIKGYGSSREGLSIRSEWNRKLSDNKPSLEPFIDLDIGQELERNIGKGDLLPIFTTRFKRTSLDLICEDGSVIELALDLGEIEADAKKEPISELELELKSGHMENVLELGNVLTQKYSLTPEDQSKYYRGLILVGLLNKISTGD
ncbi:CYTH domain-containing protein [Desulfitobacterium sp. THU1]|uniref:CYTH domain-containing protein n=1 Tax=Desulfitobacterium sp. THU1 TaxID=3138072 RepID=UPI00311F7B15